MDISPRQVAFVGILIAVPAASFFLVFRPQNQEIRKAKAEIELKRAMLTSLREVTSQAENLERATEEITGAIAKVESRMPTNKELDSVLRDVAQLADRHGLKVPKFVKSQETRQAGTAQEQPIELEITGDFDGFYQFLLALERLPRITRLTDMTLSRMEDLGRDGQMRGTFKVSIFYQGSNFAAVETK
jgi:type IV pilus assembly protein PilO